MRSLAASLAGGSWLYCRLLLTCLDHKLKNDSHTFFGLCSSLLLSSQFLFIYLFILHEAIALNCNNEIKFSRNKDTVDLLTWET